jgi:signal transduction histidine kinase
MDLMSVNLPNIVSVVLTVEYLILIAWLFLRRKKPDSPESRFIIYLGLGLLWSVGLWLRYSPLAILRSYLIDEMLMAYSMVIMPLAFLITSCSFLKLTRRWASWWLWGTGLAVAAALLDPKLDPLVADLRYQVGSFTLSAEQGVQGVFLVAWGLFLGTALWTSLREHQRAHSPLHRNRLLYWLLTTLLVMGDHALAIGRVSPYLELSAVVKVGAALTATYTLLNYHPADIRFIYRRAFSYSLITILTLTIFLLAFLATQAFLQPLQSYYVMTGAIAVALIMVMLYQPMRQAAQSLVDRIVFGKTIDYGRVLREYSQHISQVLDLERLASIVLNTAEEALGARQGFLILVEEKPDGALMLNPIHSLRFSGAKPVACAPGSPVARYFQRERRPLSQYDIDVLPEFKALDPAEREALVAWGMEIYLPIGAGHELSGILALGAKASNDLYTERDLDLLSTLADQTAVALKNARLFAELKATNAELQMANRRLQEMDDLKSAFLSVITQELRSPFVPIDFSLQLIQRAGVEHLTAEQKEQLQQLDRGLKEVRAMIDNLIAFAGLLSKQGELKIEPVHIGQIAQEVVQPLMAIAQSRQVELTLHIAEPIPLILGDRRRLTEAMYHLVHNALKYNRPGGQARVGCRATNDHVIFEVVDTGQGIPPERLGTIWEDFPKVTDPLRRGVEGLGLGLPLVKYVVSAHEGEVWALSQVNVGSTFGFSLPIKATAEPATASLATSDL